MPLTHPPQNHQPPCATVDTVILTIKNNQLQVLIIKRKHEPFKHMWSLVGGIVDVKHDQSLEDTAQRKLLEKTNITAPYLEQYQTIGNAHRDPRGFSTSTIYFALIHADSLELHPGKGALEIKWSSIKDNHIQEPLAFDHAEILAGCLERIRSKVMYTTLPVYLLPKTFTLSELQQTYEIIMDKKIERKSFHRRMLGANLLQKTGENKYSGRRPAAMYELINRDNAHYFSRNIGQSF